MILLPLVALLAGAQDLPTFRSDAQFIRVDVQVLSHRQPVLGLKQEDFRVWDEREPQTITNFGTEDQPMDLILLLDISSSTTPIEGKIKDSACEALKHLRPGDRVGVVIFFSRPLLIIPPSSDLKEVEAAIRAIRWDRAGTELNRSSLTAAMYLSKQARPEARRAVIILSDNVGYGVIPDYKVIDGLWQSNVIYNALLFGKATAGADVRVFAKATGGETRQIGKGDIPFGEMFQRIRERYSLLYRAPEAELGTVREIKVDLVPEKKSRIAGLEIRARTGYRALPPRAPSPTPSSRPGSSPVPGGR